MSVTSSVTRSMARPVNSDGDFFSENPISSEFVNRIGVNGVNNMQMNVLHKFDVSATFPQKFPTKFKLLVARCKLLRRSGIITELAMLIIRTLEKLVLKSMIDWIPPTSPKIHIVRAESLN